MQEYVYIDVYRHPHIPVEVVFAPKGVTPLPLPEYKSLLASGFDLQADLPEPGTAMLSPGETRLIPTGFYIAVPPGWELQVRSRSGLALKQGLVVLNQPGTVDADYRGEVFVMLHNTSSMHQSVSHGDRIAQGVICPVIQAKFSVVEQLRPTARGTGGFGSTGK